LESVTPVVGLHGGRSRLHKRVLYRVGQFALLGVANTVGLAKFCVKVALFVC
jgi:hypothetical protein